uniref:Electron transfer flavoprotein subunit beta n=1 Tax=Chlorobium chlorochromatii (strain CaD3) TaxID=340177 RepID=Q3ATE2_CHLCH
MNIVVALCQVPDVAPLVVDGALDLSRVSMVMNPYDEYALEEALRCRERFPNCTVTAVTVAALPPQELLRKALALGVDRAVFVESEELRDSYSIASRVSEAIRMLFSEQLPELCFFGKQSTDYQSGAVPAMVAHLLGLPFVSAITSLTPTAEQVEVTRDIEGGSESFMVAYPALFSTEKGLNELRHTTVKMVMEGRKKKVEHLVLPLQSVAPRVALQHVQPLERSTTCTMFTNEAALASLLAGYRAAL